MKCWGRWFRCTSVSDGVEGGSSILLRADQCVSEQISGSVLLCCHLIYLCRPQGPHHDATRQLAHSRVPVRGVQVCTFRVFPPLNAATALRVNPDSWDKGQASEDLLLVLNVVLSKEMDERNLLFLDTLSKEPPAGDCISQYTYRVAQHNLEKITNKSTGLKQNTWTSSKLTTKFKGWWKI